MTSDVRAISLNRTTRERKNQAGEKIRPEGRAQCSSFRPFQFGECCSAYWGSNFENGWVRRRAFCESERPRLRDRRDGLIFSPPLRAFHESRQRLALRPERSPSPCSPCGICTTSNRPPPLSDNRIFCRRFRSE